MNGLTRFSMKNVSAVFIMVAILFTAGLYTAGSLKEENMPNVTFPVVMVSTTYTGSPNDVMEKITKPLEEKLANVQDIESMSSNSSENSSRIMLKFESGVDIDKKKTDVEDQLAQASLPSSAGTPKASTFGNSDQATNYLVLYGENGLSQSDLDKYYQETIEPGIESINGLDHLDVIGARDTSLDIEMNADALQVYELSTSTVANAISAAVTASPVGSVEINGNDKSVRVTGKVQSIYDLENVEITTSSGKIVKLSQVAKVKAVNESKFVGRLDGQSAIGIILYKSESANAVEFSDAIQAKLESLKAAIPNISFKNVYDSAGEIKESITGLIREGVVGMLLASLMILLFLRNIRMTLIVLVSLPLSIFITLLLMYYFDLTLNSMTIGGIFIAIGRVVDDSIVVIENIYSSLSKANERNESVIKMATAQVARAITSSTLATVGVFAPMGMVTGMIGGFFKPFAITIAVALLSSLLVALTVIPMLAKLLVLKGNRIKHHDEQKRTTFMRRYEHVLHWCLKHRLITLLVTAAVFAGTLFMTVPNLKMSFLPSSKDSSTMYFQLKLPYSTSFEATNVKTKQIEEYLSTQKDSSGNPVFSFVESLVGYSGDDEKKVPYASQIYVEVNDKLDAAAVKTQIKAYILSELPKGSTVEPRSIGGGFGVSTTDFNYQLKGKNQVSLEKAAEQVKAKLQEFPELSEVSDNLSDSSTEVEIAVDQKSARAYGLNPSTVMTTAQNWVKEQSLGDITLDNVSYTTKVMLEQDDKNSVEKLGNIPFTTSDGKKVYLKEIAKVYEKPSASTIRREDQNQLVSVTAKINSADKSRVSMQVSMELRKMELPEGVTTAVRGVNTDMNESFRQLGIAMIAAVAVVYLIMVLAFGNAMAPLAILFSLPLAAIGGLIGLYITGTTLDVTSMIGFMMLIGIVVTNAIVLIDRAQQLREEGYVVRQALIEAGIVRLRPIIMTAGATVVALIPLAMGLSGEGTLIGKGLGIVVIGGLITSTILTLVIVPIVYELLEGMRNFILRLFHKGSDKDIPTMTMEG